LKKLSVGDIVDCQIRIGHHIPKAVPGLQSIFAFSEIPLNSHRAKKIKHARPNHAGSVTRAGAETPATIFAGLMVRP